MTGLSAPKLRQRDRAAIDFFGHLGMSAMPLRAAIDADLAAKQVTANSLPDDLDQRSAVIEAALADSKVFRAQQLMGEWHARQHGPTATAAFETIKDELAGELAATQQGTTTLELSDAAAPAYWDGVDFHRTAGGWDGHPYAGYIHGEIVHRKMVDRLFPGGIFKQRKFVAGLAPRRDYARILDMGCSTGHFTQALAETFPQAQITGVDLSARALEHAKRAANAQGLAWSLFQRPAENTGFADGSFDLVASYILLHELPADTVAAVFREAYRVLAPGGDMIMSDVTRYADMDKLAVWRADYGARMGGEPHWRASASLDLKAIAEAAGFVDVTVRSEPPFNYPHVVMGRKAA
jgi:SAM-dependent methyltransferase